MLDWTARRGGGVGVRRPTQLVEKSDAGRARRKDKEQTKKVGRWRMKYIKEKRNNYEDKGKWGEDSRNGKHKPKQTYSGKKMLNVKRPLRREGKERQKVDMERNQSHAKPAISSCSRVNVCTSG